MGRKVANIGEEGQGLMLLGSPIFEPLLSLDGRTLSSGPLCLELPHDFTMEAAALLLSLPWSLVATL